MRILFKIVKVLTIVGITLGLGEFILRLLPNSIDNQLSWTTSVSYKLDSDLIYSRLPNRTWIQRTDEFEEKIVSNNLGFRDKNIDKKSNNIYRIIAVGDSFTFGRGIENNEESYPKQLELYLNKTLKINKNIEVVNAAEKGYSPDQEYRQIRKRLLSLSPDMIIWNFSFPGDLDNLTHNFWWPIPSLYDIKDNHLKELNAKYNWLYISNFWRYRFPFLNKSRLFNLSVRLLANFRVFSRKPRLSPDKMMDWARQKMLLEVEDIEELGRQKGFLLLVVFLPYPETFSPQYQDSNKAIIIDSLKNELLSKKVSVIDVKEGIDNYLIGKQDLSFSNFYFKKDYHPNKAGVSLFAKIVGDKIKEKLNP